MNENKQFRDLAKLVVWRNKERLNIRKSDKEEEKERFFFWVMKEMLWEIESSSPARMYNQIKLEATVMADVVCIKHGYVDEFYSDTTLPPKEFFEIMEETSDILNSLPNFHTSFTHIKDSMTAELYINLHC